MKKLNFSRSQDTSAALEKPREMSVSEMDMVIGGAPTVIAKGGGGGKGGGSGTTTKTT